MTTFISMMMIAKLCLGAILFSCVNSELVLYTTPNKVYTIGDVVVFHCDVPDHSCPKLDQEETGVDFLINNQRVCSVILFPTCTLGSNEQLTTLYKCGCMGTSNKNLYLNVTRANNKHLTGNWTAQDIGSSPGCLKSNTLSLIKQTDLDQQARQDNDGTKPRLKNKMPKKTTPNPDNKKETDVNKGGTNEPIGQSADYWSKVSAGFIIFIAIVLVVFIAVLVIVAFKVIVFLHKQNRKMKSLNQEDDTLEENEALNISDEESEDGQMTEKN